MPPPPNKTFSELGPGETGPPNEQQGSEFPPVLTTAMAADMLQVHVEYLRRMVREDRIPCHRFPGGREMRFLRDELLSWLAQQDGMNRAPSASGEAEGDQ